MAIESKQRGLAIGALIGAVLGAGAAYLLMTAPANLSEDEEPKPITPKELLRLTGTAAILIRTLDDLRRRT
jgi:gas vesicle protein